MTVVPVKTREHAQMLEIKTFIVHAIKNGPVIPARPKVLIQLSYEYILNRVPVERDDAFG